MFLPITRLLAGLVYLLHATFDKVTLVTSDTSFGGAEEEVCVVGANCLNTVQHTCSHVQQLRDNVSECREHLQPLEIVPLQWLTGIGVIYLH